MGATIARQHPPVVLRSQFDQLRTLLVVALIAVSGLTVAVAILASDSDELAVGTRAALPAQLPKTSFDEGTRGPLPAQLPKTSFDEGTRGPLPAQLPKTSFDEGTRGPLPAQLPKTSFDEGTRGPLPAQLPNTRYDGGPEEGSADVTPAPPKVTQQQAFPGLAGQASASSGVEAKHEAATAAAIGQSSDGTVTRGSKTDPHGPASLLP
jgi:hypothetical protein